MSTSSLGRGLGSLIPQKKEVFSASSAASSSGILFVEINQISPNPLQPRQTFTQEELQELADSIKEHGILQPLLVTKKEDNSYELIAGERRLKAAKLAGLAKVPVLVKEVKDDKERLYLALIENLQREDLDPLEEAIAYRKLHEEFGLSHQEIAESVGKSRPVISNTIRLLNLPDYIQKGIKSGKIAPAQARILVTLPSKAQKELYEKFINEGLTLSKAEQIVQRVKSRSFLRHSLRKSPEIVAKEEELQEKFDTKVSIRKRGERGQIVIDFYSEEEFNALLKKLLK